jgi:hypothetical protein
MIIYVNTAYRIIRLAGDGFCLGEGEGGYMVVGLDRNQLRDHNIKE